MNIWWIHSGILRMMRTIETNDWKWCIDLRCIDAHNYTFYEYLNTYFVDCSSKFEHEFRSFIFSPSSRNGFTFEVGLLNFHISFNFNDDNSSSLFATSYFTMTAMEWLQSRIMQFVKIVHQKKEVILSNSFQCWTKKKI